MVNTPTSLPKQTTFEVWAQLFLSSSDCERIRIFLTQKFNIKTKFIPKKMHVTVYYARRPMPSLVATNESVSIVVPAVDTRFMVMAPGGENPRPNLDPAQRKVGIRVQWQSHAMQHIQTLRERLLKFETPEVLGRRSPSTLRANAFGARGFQPHMTLLRAGSGAHRDLKLLGAPFREHIGELHFNRFQIEIVRRDQNGQTASKPTATLDEA